MWQSLMRAVCLRHDPRLAEEQAREILKVVPREAEAHILLGAALSTQRRTLLRLPRFARLLALILITPRAGANLPPNCASRATRPLRRTPMPKSSAPHAQS